MEVAGAFDGRLRALGWRQGERIPRAAARSFMNAFDWGGAKDRAPAKRVCWLLAWHRPFQKSARASAVAGAVQHPRRRSEKLKAGHVFKWKGRKRAVGGGRGRKCAWMRQA
eukprot:1734694-Pyramimonas_sp.AAC.1